MKIKSFFQAKKFLYQRIPTSASQKYPAGLGFKRAKYFLKLLGNPQEKIKVIHIAGTSGKGSTAYLTSIILKSLGFKVGLHVSPHLLDLRERAQINNNLISQPKFVYYFNKLLPFIKKMAVSKYGKVSYFEILVGLAFYIFYQEKVDFAVMETGMGGLYDATNTVSSKDKLVILTRIGLDHTNTLGKTFKKIAFQKASIVQKGNTLISFWQKKQVREIIKQIAKEKQAKFFLLKKNKNFNNIKISLKKTVFDFEFENYKLKEIKLGLIGFHQVENCSLALTAVFILSRVGNFKLDFGKIRKALTYAYFPGRLEIIGLKNKKVIIDGAHNPQKIASLIKSLKIIFPKRKFCFLIAFKKGKDYRNILKKIIPLAENVIITSFFTTNQDLAHFSEGPINIKKVLYKLNFENCIIINNFNKALKAALAVNKDLVITGSLYLIGEIYPELKQKKLTKNQLGIDKLILNMIYIITAYKVRRTLVRRFLIFDIF